LRLDVFAASIYCTGIGSEQWSARGLECAGARSVHLLDCRMLE